MKFQKEDLIELSYCTDPNDGFNDFKVVSNEMVGRSRWLINYELIFRHNEGFYRTRYSLGATESQDYSPYEYEPDEIECEEVFPVEKTITVFKSKKQLDGGA